MAGEVVRDVVIRIGLEQIAAKLEVPDTAPAARRVKALNDETKNLNEQLDQQRKKATEALGTVREQSLRAGEGLKQAGEGAFTAARGIAFLTAATGANTAEVLRYVSIAQGAFDVFKGVVDATKGISEARAALTKITAAATVAELAYGGALGKTTKVEGVGLLTSAALGAKRLAGIGIGGGLTLGGLGLAGLAGAGGFGVGTLIDRLAFGGGSSNRTQLESRDIISGEDEFAAVRAQGRQRVIGGAQAGVDAVRSALDRQRSLAELLGRQLDTQEAIRRERELSVQFERDLASLGETARDQAERELLILENRADTEQRIAQILDQKIRKQQQAVTLAEQEARATIQGGLSAQERFAALDPLQQRRIGQLAGRDLGTLNRSELDALAPFGGQAVTNEQLRRANPQALENIGRLGVLGVEASAARGQNIESQVAKNPAVQQAREALQAAGAEQRQVLRVLEELTRRSNEQATRLEVLEGNLLRERV